MTGRTGWGYDTDKIRLLWSRHLRGSGIELGPGHHPYVLTLPLVDVRYVDRWEPAENRALFPELGEEAEFPQPDVVANLDAEQLDMFPDASQDFVIASHVLEHLANPLAMLVQIHRVLRPGGVLLLLLPDKRMTSDAVRPLTTVEHLVAEYQADVREVDDAHLREYVRLVQGYDGEDPDKDAELLATARLRSVHVHCWTEETWFPVLERAVADLGCAFDLVELVVAGDIPGSKEFGYVLRRTEDPRSPAEEVQRLAATRELLLATRFAQGELATRQAVSTLNAKLAARDRELARIRSHPAYKFYRAGRQAQARLTRRGKD